MNRYKREYEHKVLKTPRVRTLCPSCNGTGGIGHCNKCNASGYIWRASRPTNGKK